MSLVACLCLLSFTCFLLPGALAQGNCSSPPRFEYGELDEKSLGMSNFSVGTTVTYTCRPGYTRIPGKANSITCLDTLEWTVIPEFCDRRDCGSPGDLENGEFHLPDIEGTSDPDTKFGSTATYTCNPGYRLTGRDTRTCTASGWNNAIPRCEVVICVKPPELANGTHTDADKEEFTYQSAVVYSCNPGFSLIGKDRTSCTANGTWSDPAPRCKIVSCSAPDVTNGERITGFGPGPFKYKETVTFQCKKGFSMNGTALVECDENSSWHPPLPTCVFVVPTSTTPSTTTATHKPDETEASTAQTTADYISKSEASTFQSTKENNRVDEASTVQSTKNNSMEDKDPNSGNGGAHLIVGNMTFILTMLIAKWLMAT